MEALFIFVRIRTHIYLKLFIGDVGKDSFVILKASWMFS